MPFDFESRLRQLAEKQAGAERSAHRAEVAHELAEAFNTFAHKCGKPVSVDSTTQGIFIRSEYRNCVVTIDRDDRYTITSELQADPPREETVRRNLDEDQAMEELLYLFGFVEQG